jgi:hypothetical protein
VSEIYLACNVRTFHVMITLRCRDLKLVCSRFCYHAYKWLYYVHFTCEVDYKTMILGCEPSLMELFVKMHVWIDDRKKKCNRSWRAELSTLWHVVFNHFFFLSYYFFKYADFCFQDTYTPD